MLFTLFSLFLSPLFSLCLLPFAFYDNSLSLSLSLSFPLSLPCTIIFISSFISLHSHSHSIPPSFHMDN
ncbi:hypothetical protein BCR41DRAFT_364892 [Lobosporangium transversale]|uniref:Uncharacterized protein n=1 Tax=Lobosporangium transversale TaxID=64571 RepID=A0A1Y2G7K4_9FUNG|nr:hypothetical protein BCR41DRAFT_364892 [Lobosporangium transversale]ORY96067.1 hypothetical protein BCR41DRAFT_364892 [Lobosporangium transversale]|eukprot:XP_021875494.1 hypothetical protein BCR41DRAFT_364892 [Lobosporangium transversale]